MIPCGLTLEFTGPYKRRLYGSGATTGWTKPLRGGNSAVGLKSKYNLIPSPEGLFHDNQ